MSRQRRSIVVEYDRSTAKTAGAVTLGAGVVVVGTAAVFRWGGGPALWVGLGLGTALLTLGVVWLLIRLPPRFLPALTMVLGLALAAAPLVMFYRREEWLGVAYATHIVIGLAVALLGYWTGKRLHAPRADRL